jgi:hypothetical protein
MNGVNAYRAVALACTLLTSGCVAYRHRVSDDFRDAVKLNVGVGLGFYAHAKATSFLDAGFGWGGYWQNVGFQDRYTDFVHPSMNGCPFPLGVFPGALPDTSPWTSLRMANIRATSRFDMEDDYLVAGQLFDGKAMLKWDAYGAKKRSAHDVFKNDEPSYTEQPCGFEGGVGLGVLNVNAGFDPVEFCDFLGAVCGWNLLHDKSAAPKRVRAKEGQPAHSATNQPPPDIRIRPYAPIWY